MSILEINFSYLPKNKISEKGILRFEITNISDKNIYLLKWYTPLEGLYSDCLLVNLNNERVHYDGIFAKRGNPTINDFAKLTPGKRMSKEIDISKAYSLKKGGNVSVEFNTRGLIFYNHNLRFISKESLVDKKNLDFDENVVNRIIKFQVPKNKSKSLTLGEKYRSEEKKNEKQKENKKAQPFEPTIIGATQAEKQIIRSAHFAGYEMAKVSYNSIANNNLFRLWFGIFEQNRFDTVKENYKKIKDRIESSTFTYFKNGKDCQSGWYAYTFQGSSSIWFCQGFWDAPAVGTDSQAGTVLHEHSHATSFTKDLTYGQSNSLILATKDPDNAIKNADNHEYFSGG